jgi:hypothetical protein
MVLSRTVTMQAKDFMEYFMVMCSRGGFFAMANPGW